jgi:hypothetical protein
MGRWRASEKTHKWWWVVDEARGGPRRAAASQIRRIHTRPEQQRPTDALLYWPNALGAWQAGESSSSLESELCSKQNDERIARATHLSSLSSFSHLAPDVDVGRDPRRTVDPVDAWDGISMASTGAAEMARARAGVE